MATFQSVRAVKCGIRIRATSLGVASSLALVAGLGVPGPAFGDSSQPAGTPAAVGSVVFDNVAGSSTASAAADVDSEFQPDLGTPEPELGEGTQSGPAPAASRLGQPRLRGFNGLTHKEQREAGTGAYADTQLTLEPPDQALCASDRFVVEGVNTAFAIHRADGSRLSGPVALSQFFNLRPAVVRSTPPVFGNFLSDPQCLYDADTDRFFLVVLELDRDSATGALRAPTHLFLGVTRTNDPTRDWNIFALDTTSFGGTCPCFGDQPLIATDANGLYISTNAFNIQTGGFQSVQIYAMSKSKLAQGQLPPVARITPTGAPGLVPFSLWPATSPGDNGQGHGHSNVPRRGDRGDDARGSRSDDNGTEFLLSIPFVTLVDHRVVVWKITNTGSLDSVNPSLTLSRVIVNTETYEFPRSATQREGARPLGESLHAPLSLIDAGGFRMKQVTFADGILWGAISTVIHQPLQPDSIGIAWFAIPAASADGRTLGTEEQGYVTAGNNNNVMYPSIGVNGDGKVVMVFTLVGPDFFPSAATINLTDGNPEISVVAAGAGPEDGFSGYPPRGNTARWGDYSAAAVTPDGTIWLATEYIPNLPRLSQANWGTFITRADS